jgi:hypothetical protein
MVIYIWAAWKLVQSGEFNHSAVVREFNDSFERDSSFVIRHSEREDTRSPVRNGASRRQPWTVNCHN